MFIYLFCLQLVSSSFHSLFLPFAMVRMTVDSINFCIKRKELIKNPELNEKLYLSNQGFSEISSLERFTQVNALFLSRNSIYKITNLEPLRNLRELNISNNKIGELYLNNEPLHYKKTRTHSYLPSLQIILRMSRVAPNCKALICLEILL